jgi:PAS domain S-box-containing protein
MPAAVGDARVLRGDDTPCRDVIGKVAPVVLDDVRRHEPLASLPLVGRLGIVAYLGVPLVRADRLLGVLCVFDVVPRSWSEHEVALLRELCEFAVGELERLEELARRRRAEDALRAREELFRAVFDRASQFMGVCSPDGVLLDANQAAFDLTRVDAFDVIGRPLWNAPWWSWCSAQRTAVADALQAAGDGRATRCAVQYLGEDGERHPFDFTATPVQDDDGAVTFILVEGRDLSPPRLAPVRCADPACAYADALGGVTASTR